MHHTLGCNLIAEYHSICHWHIILLERCSRRRQNTISTSNHINVNEIIQNHIDDMTSMWHQCEISDFESAHVIRSSCRLVPTRADSCLVFSHLHTSPPGCLDLCCALHQQLQTSKPRDPLRMTRSSALTAFYKPSETTQNPEKGRTCWKIEGIYESMRSIKNLDKPWQALTCFDKLPFSSFSSFLHCVHMWHMSTYVHICPHGPSKRDEDDWVSAMKSKWLKISGDFQVIFWCFYDAENCWDVEIRVNRWVRDLIRSKAGSLKKTLQVHRVQQITRQPPRLQCPGQRCRKVVKTASICRNSTEIKGSL